MSQELRHPQTSPERRYAAVNQFLPGPGGVAVPESAVGGHIVRDKQLVPPGSDGQQLPQLRPNALVDGYRADLPSLALDGDGVFRSACSAVAVSIRKHLWIRRPAYQVMAVKSSVFAADVGQLLQVVVVGQEPAEPFSAS